MFAAFQDFRKARLDWAGSLNEVIGYEPEWSIDGRMSFFLHQPPRA